MGTGGSMMPITEVNDVYFSPSFSFPLVKIIVKQKPYGTGREKETFAALR